MDRRALPFSTLPHQPKLFLQYLEDFSRVAPFYTHPPTIQELKKVARKSEFPRERRTDVVAILREQNESFGTGAATLEQLDKLEKGAVAIVTGQQVGLFSGPAFAFYKALTAIQITEELRHGGISAVPVFWMATEDHDLEEVRHVSWFQRGELKRFELPAVVNGGKPVGRIALGPQIEEPAHEAAELLAAQGSELLAHLLRESYGPGETYGSAFAKLFARLFAQQGLILMDPLDPELHRVAAPIYSRVIEDRDALNEKLLERGKELNRSEFDAQVKVTAKSTLLFYMGEGSRQAISASGATFQAGEKSWAREELLNLTQKEPQSFSPGALLRSVVQDYLLPTAGYIAGPAEISYFAQSSVVYEHVLGRMPVILPRAGFTLVDAKAAKLLRRYKLSVEDIWAGPQEVRRKMERASVPLRLAKDFDRNRKQVERMLARLGKQIEILDATLQGAVDTSVKKIEYQMEKLRRKAGRAQDQKTRLLAGHEQYLESLLYPHKTLQSRELCLLPFLARWGVGGLSELQKLCGTKHLGKHQILRLP